MADDQFSLEFDFRGTRYQEARIGLAAFARKTGRLLEPAVPALRGALEWYLKNVASAMQKRHGKAWPSGTTDNTLSKRSGTLITAIQESVKVEGTTIDTLRGSIGAAVKYARIQETGGVITPRASRYLAIPLPAAMDSRGIALKKSARDWPNTFVSRSKKGNLIIFQKQSDNSIIPLYVLKDKVVLPPRLGLGATLQTGMPLFTDRAMKQMLKAVKDAV